MHRFMLLVGMGTALMAANACSASPGTPLTAAAARNDVDEIHRLLAGGTPVDETEGPGLTPLMWAARNGAVNAMSTLLDAGADPNAHDRGNDWTPLLHAIHRRQLDSVRLLLERGADPNARTDALTPLMMAAPDQDPSFVKQLLSYGADPQARGHGGATALTQAVSGGALSDIDRPLLGGCRTETVRALKTHDPKVDIPDTIAGWNALWWAKFHGCQDVLNLVGPSGVRTKG